MPLYDYQCDQCQTQFEVRASFQEKGLGLKPVCPKCQSSVTHQLLSTSFLLRGGSSNGGSVPPSYCGPNSGSGCCGG
ncbi:MAG: FmdB family zinc ribbon protein [Anaerolineaceae bacterium]